MKFRKYLCLLLVFLFAFGIAACGKEAGSEESATDYPEDEIIDYEPDDSYGDDYSGEYSDTDYYEYYGESESLTDGIDTGYVWNESDDYTYSFTTTQITAPLSTTKFDLSALISSTTRRGAKAKTTTAASESADKTTAKSSGKSTTKAPASTKAAEGTATTSAKSAESTASATRTPPRTTRPTRATTSQVTVPSSRRSSTGTGEIVLTRVTQKTTTSAPSTATTTTTTTTTEKAKMVHVVINVTNAVNAGKTDLPKNGVLLDTEVEIKEGDTARDVLDRAAAAAGIEVKGASDYVKSIGGLREKDCGANSGWLYSVNGEFPNVGANKYKLEPGDELLWVYTVKPGDTGYNG